MAEDQLAGFVHSALRTVRLSLEAEHADIRFVRLDGGVAELRLVFSPETCADCVMPKDHLETVLLSLLRDKLPRVSEVRLDDPREQPPGPQ